MTKVLKFDPRNEKISIKKNKMGEQCLLQSFLSGSFNALKARANGENLSRLHIASSIDFAALT